MVDIKIEVFEDDSFTNYSFEVEMKKRLEKVNYRVTAMNAKKVQQKYIFKKLKLIEIILTLEDTGTEVRDLDDLDHFHEVSDCVIEGLENLSLDFYGIE
ncbi:hypothetical protein [Bacillus sp. FSL K6-3431]|uniref:hypothetical protein n=1 Tax=Bacillus sp. FSL K6-3431 TaxID=2921500 RepID=UPI0030F95455